MIDEIHIDFPTEVEEGTNWDDFVKNVHVNTNGYDEGFKFDIRQSFGPDAESLASALGYSIDLKKPTVLRFVKGIQNGINVDIQIPEELLKMGDVFADEVSVYINGEVQKVKSYGYDYAKQIAIKAPDTLTITDGEVPEAMPRYSIKSANAVVGEPISLNDLLVCDDSRVSIRICDFGSFSKADDYLTYDSDAGTLTPIQQYASGFSVYYITSFDADKDGKPEYESTGSLYFSEIYAAASDTPEPDKKHTGTARVTLLNPDGTEAGKADYPIRAGKNIPEVKNAFLESCCDAGEKSVDPYYFENGKRYTAKTVSVDDFKIYAGVDTVYGFISDQDGTDISGIQISVDGKHFYAGDRITGLTPDTAYTLYYRQYTDGTVYTREFRTAKQDYGVYIGRQAVTETNLGDLETDGWTYDPDSKTLTLKDFNLMDNGAVAKIRDYEGFADITNAVISSQDELTVKLIGDNSLQGTGRYVVVGIYAEKSLTIEGNGNLNIIGGEYGIQSNSSSIYLDGTGTLHIDSPLINGLSVRNGIVEYTNGTIHSEGCTFMNDRKEKLDLSGKTHDLDIRIGSSAEDAAEVTEAEFAEATGAYLTITPQHHDVNKTASAETYESGTCDKGCIYHLSCDCGHISEETFTAEAEEHVLVKHDAKPATCEQAGAPAYWECTHCGGRYADAAGTKPLADKDMVIPAIGHKLTHYEAKDATCDKAGSIEYWECSTCGERFADESGKTPLPDADLTTPATGHEWIQVFSKTATCDKDGCIEHWACKKCGKFSADKDGKTLLKAEDLIIPAFGHSWGAWTVIKEATETAEGEAVRVCSVCGETEKQTIPVKEPVITTTVPVTTTTAKAPTTTAKVTTTTAKTTTTIAKATTTIAKATTTNAKATTTIAKATTTIAKATTTTAKATTTTAKVTTTTAKATTTTAKATTTTAKATTTTAKATTTTAKATTTTAKVTTTTAKATTTTTKATTTTAKATTTTAKATTTTAKATTTTAKATTTTAKATTTTAKVTTTTLPETTTQAATTTSVTSESETDTTPAVTTTTGSEITPPEPEVLLGDINEDGEVSVEDAQLTLKAYTKRIAGLDMGLTERQITAANVNGDEELSVDDAQFILRYYTEKHVAGKDITWEDVLGRKPQPRPVLLTLREDICADTDKHILKAETS